MTRSAFLLLLLALLLFGCTSLPAAPVVTSTVTPAPTPSPQSFTGRVIDMEGNPLAKADVRSLNGTTTVTKMVGSSSQATVPRNGHNSRRISHAPRRARRSTLFVSRRWTNRSSVRRTQCLAGVSLIPTKMGMHQTAWPVDPDIGPS
jgi:hypothetical protein